MKRTILLLLIILTSCSKKEEKVKITSYPVITFDAIKQDVPLYIDTIGHVDPISTIQVQSRIEGMLTKAYFKEGQMVKKGQLLFTIDPKPYEASLEQAKAVYEQNLALKNLSEDKVKRYGPLVQEDYYSQGDYDDLMKDYDAKKAVMRQSQASVDSAAINLDYTYIYSPIDGKAGMYQINPGNMVFAGQNSTLVTINQIEPIYVKFSIPENQLQKLFTYQKKNSIKIRVSSDNIEKNFIEGDLNLIDNQVDNTTGTISIRGVFPNEDHVLWPGEFVQTRLIFTVEKNGILIPYQAVVSTPDGTVVFVVSKNNTVEMRSVVLGQRENQNVIVIKGIEEKESVVIDGQLNLSDGSSITISNPKKES